MAATVQQMVRSTVIVLGILAVLFGFMADNTKPVAGTPLLAGDGTRTCNFPHDPTTALRYPLTGISYCILRDWAPVYPYKGKVVPKRAMFKNRLFTGFFSLALFITGSATTMLLWPTIPQQVHLTNNVYHDFSHECPPVKTSDDLGVGVILIIDSFSIMVGFPRVRSGCSGGLF